MAATSPSPSAQGFIRQSLTFSAATASTTTPSLSDAQCKQITCLAEGDAEATTPQQTLPSQFITVFATFSGAATDTATILVIMTDGDPSATGGSAGAGRLFRDTLTLAATAMRGNAAGDGGEFVATATFAISGKNTLDLHPGQGRTFPKWYAACTAISGGPVTIYIAPGRAI